MIRHRIAGESPRQSPSLDAAVRAFVDVAKKHNVDHVHMAKPLNDCLIEMLGKYTF